MDASHYEVFVGIDVSKKYWDVCLSSGRSARFATDSDGYKAVDYSKLPLLTIQAVKELKAENDALKAEVAELRRLMTEVLANSRR